MPEVQTGGVKFHSIQNTLIRAFAALIVFTILLLGAVSLYFLRETLVQNAESTTTQLVTQMNRVIENYVKYMDDIALVTVNNEDVRIFMENPAADSPALRTRISQSFRVIRLVRKDIDSIFLITRDGRAIAATQGEGRLNPSVDLESRFREIHSGLNPGFPAVSSAHVENLVDDRYPWVISLARSMPAAADGRSVGIIQVDLNYEIIADLCRNIQLGTSGYVFILDGNGDLVYHPRQQLIYGSLKSERFSDVLALNGGYLRAVVDGREVLYTAASSSQTGWTVAAVSYPDELFSSRRHAEYYFLLLALLSFVTAIGAAHLISTTISKPIGELRRSMQAVESGNFDIDITVQTSNEIYQLARDCDIAIKKVRDLIEQNRKEQELKRALELRALQAQINPHLLYNTLDSIIWMIELGENQNAIDMTSSLAKLFRLAISKESEMISIRNEIEYVEAYLAIQKQRYKEKLSYEIAFSPELHGLKIMKLLIQPLVENAIYHGIKGMDGPGHIKIIGERENSAVVIRVGDNGVGMSAEILSALNEGNVEPSTSGGVGVKNVQERIRLSFGTEYGVRLESLPGAGTTAVVRIPVVPGDAT
jgi:two-component system sensor histidine kinase YesM